MAAVLKINDTWKDNDNIKRHERTNERIIRQRLIFKAHTQTHILPTTFDSVSVIAAPFCVRSMFALWLHYSTHFQCQTITVFMETASSSLHTQTLFIFDVLCFGLFGRMLSGTFIRSDSNLRSRRPIKCRSNTVFGSNRLVFFSDFPLGKSIHYNLIIVEIFFLFTPFVFMPLFIWLYDFLEIFQFGDRFNGINQSNGPKRSNVK